MVAIGTFDLVTSTGAATADALPPCHFLSFEQKREMLEQSLESIYLWPPKGGLKLDWQFLKMTGMFTHLVVPVYYRALPERGNVFP